MSRRRVLVLGGGCGGIAAAWALSRTPELRRRFDVTVVQPGWRLGGKGATGRDPRRGHGVLEHGLHLWLGFYRQAFGMMRDLYDDWHAPSSGPQRSIETAFSPMRHVVLWGGSAAAPRRWSMTFPEHPGRPWHDDTSKLDWLGLAFRWARELPTFVQGDAAARRVLAGLGATIALGLLREHTADRGEPWSRMDELDLRAWMRLHGASEAQLQAPPIVALYDLGFAYPEGRMGVGDGRVAAGTALRVLLRIFGSYRGAPFWRMTAGMGDTVFAPAWEVLRQRGVHFRLFHRVRHLGLRDNRIERVELGVQARDAERYDPLIAVGPVRAWPHAPVVSRLRTIVTGNLEGDVTDELDRITLQRGREFDEVVLAIPATAHHHFARELIEAHPRYAEMVRHTHAVATLSAQLWSARAYNQLGRSDAPAVETGLPDLFRTCADMSEVLDAERWSPRPAALTYLCSVAPPELQVLREQHRAEPLARTLLRQWAERSLHRLWPGARTVGGALDEGVLHCTSGADPWAQQYVRANVADWERYVLSLPGTTRHRLAPDASGFDNLVLAGDWTQNSINGGSVEGAVSSGVAAAEAVMRR